MIDRILFRMYRHKNWRLRSLIRSIAFRLEGGMMFSTTVRRIFREYHGIEIGMYTHGGCFDLLTMDPHTHIGRYCSIAKGVRIINHSHPLRFKSTSALFFNPTFGCCKDWLVDFRPLEIGNDVWIGANAIILQEVNRIGDGAVIGAGAVVNHDVPPYGVVLGNPARLVKYRFSDIRIRELLAERWWEKDLDELSIEIQSFQVPIEVRDQADRQNAAGADTPEDVS
jgi:virginiamycin A acetyltransferase